jgi:hypothetical protein
MARNKIFTYTFLVAEAERRKVAKLGSPLRFAFPCLFLNVWDGDVYGASRNYEVAYFSVCPLFSKNKNRPCGPATCCVCVCVCVLARKRERERLHLCNQNELTLYIGSSSRFMKFEVLLQWILLILWSSGLWRRVTSLLLQKCRRNCYIHQESFIKNPTCQSREQLTVMSHSCWVSDV